MHTKLVIVADLGLLRAYREVKHVHDHQPHLVPLEELKLEMARARLSDQVTDQAGRFPRGGGPANTHGDLSAGERLGLEAEQSRRLIGQLAAKINTLLGDPRVDTCALAASTAIHKTLLATIDPKARAKITQVVAADLTKVSPHDLPAHFANSN